MVVSFSTPTKNVFSTLGGIGLFSFSFSGGGGRWRLTSLSMSPPAPVHQSKTYPSLSLLPKDLTQKFKDGSYISSKTLIEESNFIYYLSNSSILLKKISLKYQNSHLTDSSSEFKVMFCFMIYFETKNSHI